MEYSQWNADPGKSVFSRACDTLGTWLAQPPPRSSIRHCWSTSEVMAGCARVHSTQVLSAARGAYLSRVTVGLPPSLIAPIC
jgi:hypothetical protein